MATVLLFALALPLAVVLALLLGSAAYRAVGDGAGGLRSTITVSALFFGVWQAWTAVALGVGEREAVDLRRTLQYPVAPGRIYALGLASGVLGDPFAAFWLVLLAGSFLGAALGRPGAWLLPLAAVYAAFAAGTVALVALIQEALARLARRRNVRELSILAGVAGWVLLLAGSRQSMATLLPLLRRIQWLFFPPALASAAARSLYAGRVVEALPPLALLAAAAWLTGWLAYRLALSTALSGGEEGRVAPGPSGAVAPRLLPERLGPLAEKEVRYLLRHPISRVSLLLVPAVGGVLAWKVTPRIPAEAGELLRGVPLLGLALLSHLVVQPFWLNAFGADRGGARALFLAPVAPRSILAAKNGALAGLAGLLFAASAATYLALADPPDPWLPVGAALLHLGLGPVLYGSGNLVSILNPRAAPFAVQRGGAVPALSSMAGMAIVSGAGGLFGAPVLLALWTDALWLVVAGWLALAAVAWAAWWHTLPLAGRLLARRREQLLAAVCGDDA